MKIKDRREIPLLLNELGLINVGVEVGVLEGEFSKTILDSWYGRKLWLVDPWSDQKDYIDWMKCDQNVGYKRLAKTIERLHPHEGRYEIERNHSPEAAEKFMMSQLDFVYLDGNHSYNTVSAEIRAWWPKIRMGGLLMGHDYLNCLAREGGHPETFVGPDHPRGELTSFGVQAAVDDWLKETKLELHLTGEDHPYKSWLVRKL